MKLISKISLMALSLVLIPVPQALGQDTSQQISGCRPVEGNPTQSQCELHLSNKTLFKSASVKGGEKTAAADFTPFEAVLPAPMIYFLLDTSPSVETADFQRLKSVITRSLKAGPFRYAVYAFSRSLDPIARAGTPVDTIRLALNSVPQTRAPPEGLKSIFELVDIIKGDPSERRVLVILSNGDFEDSAYPPSEVIARLHAAAISVVAISPLNSPQAITAAQSIRRIASATGGPFFSIPNTSGVEAGANRIMTFVEAGGILKFAVLDKTTSVTVELTDGRKLTTTYVADALPAPPSPPQVENEKQGSQGTLFSFWSATIASWYNASLLNKSLAWSAAVLFMGLLIGSSFWVRGVRAKNRRHREQLLRPPVTQNQSGRNALAVLEFLDGDSSHWPIYRDSTTIGRHDDNQLVLKNTSVHRHHAILNREPDGTFTIMDLETDNGVAVNGKRIKKCPLNTGDIIELGEVRIRFDGSR